MVDSQFWAMKKLLGMSVSSADNLYLVICHYLPYWIIPKGSLQTPLHTIAVDCSCLLRSSLAPSPGKLGDNWGGSKYSHMIGELRRSFAATP